MHVMSCQSRCIVRPYERHVIIMAFLLGVILLRPLKVLWHFSLREKVWTFPV